jgi:hypothetical protein
MNSLFISNHYCFWVAVGVLIYLGGSLFFYLSINKLSKDEMEAFGNTYGNLTYLAEGIKNILFALSLFMYARYPSGGSKNKTETVPYLDMI